MDVLIVVGPLSLDSETRRRHESGLIEVRVVAAAAVVRGVVLSIVVPALIPPPAFAGAESVGRLDSRKIYVTICYWLWPSESGHSVPKL